MERSSRVGREFPFPRDLGGLTSLRFLLATGVVLFHYHVLAGWNDAAYTGLIERGRLGVDVFFVLSGFVLAHAYHADLEAGRLDYPRFLLNRFARIYPAHLAVLVGVLGLVGGASLMGAEFTAGNFTLEGLVKTLALTHAWFPTRETYEWNGPSWSLSAEWFAYLAFPLFAFLAARLRPWALLALAAALFLGLDALYRAVRGAPLTAAEFDMGVLRILPEFLYGMGLYRLGLRLNVSLRLAWGAVAAAAVLLLGLAHLGADERLIVAAAGPLILALAVLAKGGGEEPLARPWMRLLGEASYALYLLHFPAIYAFQGLSGLIGRPDGQAPSLPELAALYAVTVLTAIALHLAWERPARRLIRGLGVRRSVDNSPLQP